MTLEIMQQNVENDSWGLLYFLLSVLAIVMPLIVHKLVSPDSSYFKSWNHKMAFYVSILPQLLISIFNYILFNAMRSFMIQKKKFKMAVMTQIDNKFFKHYYDKECSHDLPEIDLHTHGNLTATFNLIALLQKIHSTHMNRGFMFVSVIIVICML